MLSLSTILTFRSSCHWIRNLGEASIRAMSHDVIDLTSDAHNNYINNNGNNNNGNNNNNNDNDNFIYSTPPQSPVKKRLKKSVETTKRIPAMMTPAPLTFATTSATDKPPPFHICTYNVWFGSEENAGPYAEERMNEIIKSLLPHAPRMIGFQEVTPLLAQILDPLLKSAGYQCFSQDLSGFVVGYGCVVAVRADHIVEGGFKPFRTSQLDRGISYAILQFDGREIIFTTTHAESWCGPNYIGAKQREMQLQEMTNFCDTWMTKRPSIDMAVITGDLNWDDWRPKSEGDNKPLEQVVGPEWLDTWKLLYPDAKKDPGYTYDGKINPMLNSSLRRRFDRCLIRTNKKSISVEKAFLIGMHPIPGISWTKGPTNKMVPVTPSDHYGLVIKIQY